MTTPAEIVRELAKRKNKDPHEGRHYNIFDGAEQQAMRECAMAWERAHEISGPQIVHATCVKKGNR